MNKFCKSCGKELEDNYKICPYCGEKIEDEIQIENIEKKEENTRICQFCGKSINADFKICPYCSDKDLKISKKSGVVCLLLLIFLFPLWAHRLYAGKIGSAFFRIILNFITFVLLVSPFAYIVDSSSESIGYNIYNYEDIIRTQGVIGAFLFIGIMMALVIFVMLIIDLVFIIVGKFKDADGKYIKTNN